MALQEAYKMKPILMNHEVNNELEALKCKLGVATEIILPGLPRTFSRKNIRFELPLDKKSLKGEQFFKYVYIYTNIIIYLILFISDMTPLQYLSSNISIIGSCQIIYSRVFEKYVDSETRKIPENVNCHRNIINLLMV
jgi:hypothetical protein